MKNIYLIFTALLLTQTSFVSAQDLQKANAMSIQYKDLPQEGIYVHYSSSVLFAGEYLFYKVFCLNKDTNWLSGISEIAYVELISESGVSVFRHKVELEAGEANSEFFVPTSLNSGSYKLIAYTRWMRNLGLNNFFQADIGIVNPYKQNQDAILASGIKENSDIDTNSDLNTTEENTAGFRLQLEKKTYGMREKVVLNLKNFKGQKGHGKYSLSIRKRDAVSRLLEHNNINSNTKLFKSSPSNKLRENTTFYLPESSGTILKGKVIEKQSKLPVKQNVAISVSGKNFLFRAKTTNDKGEFTFFALDANYENNEAVIQVLGDAKKDYEIVMEEDTVIDYSSLSFAPFQIDASLRNVITERSIYNQIENGYYSIKPDTIRPVKPKVPFTYYEEITTTNLDEFTRFSTMKEVFTELIKNAWTGTDTLGNDVVKVRQEDDDEETDFLPLLFIDGVFVQNHDHLLNYNARKVDKISVLRKYYIFGTLYYQGVILVETKLKDYQNQDFGDHIKNVELFQPQQRKNYFEQSYSIGASESETRTPDYRTQLLWEPNIELSTNEMSFQFFTSDNLGEYEISLEGLTIEGKPVSMRQLISVE